VLGNAERAGGPVEQPANRAQRAAEQLGDVGAAQYVEHEAAGLFRALGLLDPESLRPRGHRPPEQEVHPEDEYELGAT
jgi:hypothetical protein